MAELYAESYGERGCKVRVYEPRPGADFMLARFLGGKYHTKTLGHRDPVQAKAAAYAVIAQVTSGKEEEAQAEPSRLTLKALVALYIESDQFKDLAPRQQKEKESQLGKILAYFGPTKLVVALDDDGVRGLLRARREGGHPFKKAGKQSEYHCYAALRSVILWGTEKKTITGAKLVKDNPILGMAKRLSIRPNKTPHQPIIGHMLYETLRRAARKLPLYTRVFLIVAEGTGRRESAMRGLRWSDVDLETGRILWRSEGDKMNMEMYRPITPRVRQYLRVWKKYCPVSEWVFPAPQAPLQPVPKATVDKWPAIIYDAAGLVKPKGMGWHSLRRKWATERRGFPVPDLMAAGGWASAEALMRYLKTDEAMISAVIMQPTRRA